jgi:predicted nucleotidyltransferase
VPPDELAHRLGVHPATARLRLVVLHGSRARGEAHPGSDRDLGVLGDGPVDLAAVGAAVVEAVGSDAVDVVDLSSATALLRYRAACDGVPLLESPHGAFADFQVEAATFWCDVEPVVRDAHERVLADLP